MMKLAKANNKNNNRKTAAATITTMNSYKRYLLRCLFGITCLVYMELRIKYGVSSELDSIMMMNHPTFKNTNDDKKMKEQMMVLPSIAAATLSSTTHNNTKAVFQKPSTCTDKEIDRIKKQLPLDHCKQGPHDQPYLQKCSLTLATKCPDATWVDTYYKSLLEKRLLKNKNNHKENRDESSSSSSSSSFVGIYVGCNKGFDAVKTLRMGTFNDKYSKHDWKSQMGKTHQSVCNQNVSPEFDLHQQPSSSSTPITRTGHVFCIEPMPQTVQRLSKSAQILGWADELIITEAGIAKESGNAYFPSGTKAKAGVENQGMGNCDALAKKKNKKDGKKLLDEHCRKVPVYSLDDYAQNVTTKYITTTVQKKDEPNHSTQTQNQLLPTINFLSIDVEGYDFDVILGASQTLQRTEYLEFEYNWMGSWSKQTLKDAIEVLSRHQFICYFAGIDKLWRITDCFVEDLYSYRTWSNVACVNAQRVPDIATEMESIFQRTLQDEHFTPYLPK